MIWHWRNSFPPGILDGVATEGRIVLLVEDDPNDILLMGRAFTQAGLENNFNVVRDGDEAISYLKGARPSKDGGTTVVPALVLLDLKIPKKPGLEVLEWIRKQPHLKHVPVVVLTSSREEKDLKRASALGADSFLVKPVEFTGLLEIVKALKLRWLELKQGN